MVSGNCNCAVPLKTATINTVVLDKIPTVLPPACSEYLLSEPTRCYCCYAFQTCPWTAWEHFCFFFLPAILYISSNGFCIVSCHCINTLGWIGFFPLRNLGRIMSIVKCYSIFQWPHCEKSKIIEELREILILCDPSILRRDQPAVLKHATFLFLRLHLCLFRWLPSVPRCKTSRMSCIWSKFSLAVWNESTTYIINQR